MKSIQKYFWQLLGVAFAIISILAAYHRFFLSRPTKALQVITEPPVSLVDIRPEVAEDIEVFYRDEPVSNISHLQVRIKNSGNQPIAEDDYSRPLSFSFAPDSDLADVVVTASDPPNIGMVISQTAEYRAEAVPTLLNPGDTVAVRFVVIGASSDSVLEDLVVDGRIAGVREIELVSSSEQPPSTLLIAMAAIGGVIVSIISRVLVEDLGRRLMRELSDRILSVFSARSAPGEEAIANEVRTVFHDAFDSFTGWEPYRDGVVSQSTDIPPRVGECSLKKSAHNDPHGGFKEIGRTVDLGFAFSGWIFSPSSRSGGKADRLAIEDDQPNGYGFAVDRDRNTVYVERRDQGAKTRLGSEVSLDNPLTDQWYQFRFFAKAGGRFRLHLYDLSGQEILNTPTVSDERYSSFNRVAVHGGFPYYVDDLRIEAL